MHITAKADYAVRAMVELAARKEPMRATDLAAAQEIPTRFLRVILADLRRAGLIISQTGSSGGFRLARNAEDIALAQVIRAVEGPLAEIRGLPPTEVVYSGSAKPLRDVWIAVRANLRAVLDHVSLAEVAGATLPTLVIELAADPSAQGPPT